MVEWNGWSGLDSAATVGIGGTGARVTHVTLRNNGHGSGLYLSAPDSQLRANWVEGGMVLKGDEHWVHHNTVERGITLVRAFGAAACGLNAASVVEDNVARVQARGNCTAADGTPVQGLPPATSRNLADAALC